MSCCIIGCVNEGASASKETTYHLFPHPTKGWTRIPFSRISVLLNMIFILFLDETRFQQWLDACNNPKFEQMDAMTIHKRYRICRRHFDSDCLNGGCRRLLNTAIPTLYLNPVSETECEIIETDTSIKTSTEASDIIYLPVSTVDDEIGEHFELFVPESDPISLTKEIKCKLACSSFIFWRKLKMSITQNVHFQYWIEMCQCRRSNENRMKCSSR